MYNQAWARMYTCVHTVFIFRETQHEHAIMYQCVAALAHVRARTLASIAHRSPHGKCWFIINGKGTFFLMSPCVQPHAGQSVMGPDVAVCSGFERQTSLGYQTWRRCLTTHQVCIHLSLIYVCLSLSCTVFVRRRPCLFYFCLSWSDLALLSSFTPPPPPPPPPPAPFSDPA
jgi:hypothetical protein